MSEPRHRIEQEINVQQNHFLPSSAVDKMIRTKTDFYKALKAKGWLLPKISSSIVTMEFLQEVRSKTIYCPMLEDVRFKPCLNPPSIEVLCEMIQNGVRASLTRFDPEVAPRAARLADRLDKRRPDTAWLLAVLAVMNPENEVFQPGYIPPKRKAAVDKPVPLAQMPVNNEDDFLSDLPQLNRRELLRGRNNIFLSKEEKLEAKLQAKMLRVQAMQESI